MQIFNFVFLSMISTSHNILTLHISKTHLPIVSFNVRELECWTDAQKSDVLLYVEDGSLPRHPRPLVSFKTY